MTELKSCRLTCEYLTNPLGLDCSQPRLGWQLQSEVRGAAQKAYQISVATSRNLLDCDEPDLWATGRLDSDQSTHVVYGGRQLVSRQRCFWKVKVWDLKDQPSTWSEIQFWEMGLLERSDWQADWIASPASGSPIAEIPSPYLKRVFQAEGKLKSARLYVTALGLYEFVINGAKVGTDVFTPGWTDYRKHIAYQVYDVTNLIAPGENVAGAILGDGWYCGNVAWARRQNYGPKPALMAQIALDYEDGTTEWLRTDQQWVCRFGPIVRSDMLMGEVYDARLELEDWQTTRSENCGWNPVEVITAPKTTLVNGSGLAVRQHEALIPISTTKHSDQWWIFDLGQNFSGRVKVQVAGKAGITLSIRYAEMLDAKGWPYTVNLRTATATDHYTLKGLPNETWEPRFTFHGFRFVEIKTTAPIDRDPEITGVVLHSPLPSTGIFECSDPLINQLQKNILWGQKSNFLEVPTDCPQRDERLGWTGDAQVFIRTAAFNANVAPFFTKWQRDLSDAQHPSGAIPAVVPNVGMGNDGPGIDGGPAWSDAVVICPWTIYLCYGDLRILEQHYSSICAYGDYLYQTSVEGSRCYDAATYWKGFGDWLAWDGSGQTEGGTPKELIGTAFFAHSSGLIARIAQLLGKKADADKFHNRFLEAKAAFQREFVTPGGRLVGGTQTAAVLALHFDLLPETLRGTVAEALASDIKKRGNHLATGFVGTPYLAHVLSASGKHETAYDLLQQTTWPSWLYSVTQGGTTIWERWNGWTHDQGFGDPGMNSFNHYAYGAIGDWLYSRVAGLDLDSTRPGYKHVIFRPQPGGTLTSARASLQTLYGLVEISWKLEGNRFSLDLLIPPNATAEVHLPEGFTYRLEEGGHPTVESTGISHLSSNEKSISCKLESGTYHFSVERSSSN